MSDPSTIVESRDAVDHLRAKGFSQLLDVLPSCIATRGPMTGRVSVHAIARRLGMSWKKANQLLTDARACLD